jgi:hypothetical protein
VQLWRRMRAARARTDRRKGVWWIFGSRGGLSTVFRGCRTQNGESGGVEKVEGVEGGCDNGSARLPVAVPSFSPAPPPLHPEPTRQRK